MVGHHSTALGGYRSTLDQRQQIALHAFAADVGAAGPLASDRDFVDFVDENDAVVLGRGDGFAHDLVFVQ